jgi:hypothetical protein
VAVFEVLRTRCHTYRCESDDDSRESGDEMTDDLAFDPVPVAGRGRGGAP